MTQSRNSPKSGDLTTAALLDAYWRVHWSSYSPSTRSKTRGRLIVMVASLLEPSRSAKMVVRALYRLNHGTRSLPTTSSSAEVRAARYLHGHFLPRQDRSLDKAHSEPSRDEVRSARWIAAHSKLAAEISDEDLMQLRIDLGGNTYQTRRTYWAGIEAVLHWALATGRLAADPSIGLPKVRRIIEVEKPVADRVPEESEIWEVAELGRVMIGEWFAVAVLLGGYGALRAGELVALRRECLDFTEPGGLWLTVAAQRRRFSKRHSDDGVSTSDFAPPKGRIAGPAASRRCYIPDLVATEISGFVSQRARSDFMFMTPRGTLQDVTSFRDAWTRVVGALPAGHRLLGITPHSLRHAGMSMWLGKGVDLKLIQAWGGWHSLKVMLDTYAALLPGAEEDSIALLEGRRSSPRTGSFPSASLSTARSAMTGPASATSRWSLDRPPWSG
jgi:integrase